MCTIYYDSTWGLEEHHIFHQVTEFQVNRSTGPSFDLKNGGFSAGAKLGAGAGAGAGAHSGS